MGSGCRRSKITQSFEKITDQSTLRQSFKFSLLKPKNTAIGLESAQ